MHACSTLCNGGETRTRVRVCVCVCVYVVVAAAGPGGVAACGGAVPRERGPLARGLLGMHGALWLDGGGADLPQLHHVVGRQHHLRRHCAARHNRAGVEVGAGR